MKLSRKVLQKRPTGSSIGRGFLDGQMLIASPGMRDERFARTLIYMCAHSSEGAMGIVINQPAPHISFRELLVKLDVIPEAEKIRLPRGGVTVLKGGPVETERGFVLHSADFFIENSTLPIDEGVCLTATLDILKAIARGAGPASAILALGYAGWSPGQLEHEISQNAWLTVEARDAIIFDTPAEERLPAAMELLGLDYARLQDAAGHA
jgi:putative transcriptional regulator